MVEDKLARKSHSTALSYLMRVQDLYKQPPGHVDRKRKYADAFLNPETKQTNHHSLTVPPLIQNGVNGEAYSPGMSSDILGKKHKTGTGNKNLKL